MKKQTQHLITCEGRRQGANERNIGNETDSQSLCGENAGQGSEQQTVIVVREEFKQQRGD